MVLARDIRLGRVMAQGFEYRITREDVAWLAAASQREDSDHPQYPAWSMVQRFVARNQRSLERTLRALVSGFSQTTNPAWAYPNPTDIGSARRLASRAGIPLNMASIRNANRQWQVENRGGRIPTPDEHTAPHRLRRRRDAINLVINIVEGIENAWESIPSNVRDCVVQICQGQTGNPIPRFTNFADERTTRRSSNTRVQFGGNYYLRDSPPVRGGSVYIVGPDGEDSRRQAAGSFPSTGAASSRYRPTSSEGEISGARSSGEDNENVSAGGAGTASSSVSQYIPGARGVEVAESYIILPKEELESRLDSWAGEVEQELTRIIP